MSQCPVASVLRVSVPNRPVNGSVCVLCSVASLHFCLSKINSLDEAYVYGLYAYIGCVVVHSSGYLFCIAFRLMNHSIYIYSIARLMKGFRLYYYYYMEDACGGILTTCRRSQLWSW